MKKETMTFRAIALSLIYVIATVVSRNSTSNTNHMSVTDTHKDYSIQCHAGDFTQEEEGAG